tara:strand:- start:45 stop:893 length:849 start_codon:yes stop_codon:yes gene_type:complete
MRVLFISDFTLEQRQGGAQVSNKLLIDKGRELGLDIKEHHHNSSVTDFLSSYDLVINSNLEAISKISPPKIPLIIKSPNSVRLEHDSCSYLDDETRKLLFSKAKKNFFLSNYHYNYFKHLYGDYFHNVEIVYDPIDTSKFKKSDHEKTYDVVYCGYLHSLKGLNNLLKFAKQNTDRQIDIFGWGELSPQETFKGYDNINFNGQLKYEEIPSIFQSAKAIFHQPIVNEPFCRMVGEAILCGVEEIIGDKSKIGAYLEFNDVGYKNFKDGCENAPSIFWERVLK